MKSIIAMTDEDFQTLIEETGSVFQKNRALNKRVKKLEERVKELEEELRVRKDELSRCRTLCLNYRDLFNFESKENKRLRDKYGEADKDIRY